MGWEKGYYYRKQRRDGHVRSKYIGTVRSATAMANADAVRRALRAQEAEHQLAALAMAKASDHLVAVLERTVQDVLKASLLAAGYHQHKRQWRLRRD